MDNFFNPKTIAVVGASNKKGKVGYSLIENLKEFKGKVFPVNVNDEIINGKKAYKSLLEIKEKIDLVVVSIPAAFVKDVIKDCIKNNVKNVIVISAGFSEVGNKQLEEEIVKLAKGKLRLLGPNCFGVVNSFIGLNTSFAKNKIKKGDIGFISQSGALWSAIVDYSIKEDFGFSKFASLGNMSDVNFSDLISYFEKDKDTRAIVLYIEYLKDGIKFIETVKKCKKPVIVIKAGRSKAGEKAALSHTGSMTGSYDIYKQAFRQGNCRLADGLIDAFDKARFSFKAKNVLVVTNAGGPGALMADYLEENKLNVVNVPKLNFSFNYSGNNPLDVIGDATSERFKEVFNKIKNMNFYDTLVVILTPQKMTDLENIAEEIVKFKKESKKNVVVCWMSKDDGEVLKKNNIPHFFDIKRCAELLR